MTDFKPMLASPADLTQLTFPLLASPKLDGIRAMVLQEQLKTRKLKDVPNRFISEMLSREMFDGIDGELIVGKPTSKTCYLDTVSGVMSRDGEPDFTFYVFDDITHPASAYEARYAALLADFKGAHARVKVLKHEIVRNMQQLLVLEERFVNLGYEGLMLRDPRAPYKFGRSTTREGILLKWKRFEDSEAEILGVEEEMHNGNMATRDELGRTKRSTHKANKTGKGTMGALKVRDIHHGWVFNIGTGFTAPQRAAPWTLGSVIKYRYFPVGMKDVPRHPSYIGPRDRSDM